MIIKSLEETTDVRPLDKSDGLFKVFIEDIKFMSVRCYNDNDTPIIVGKLVFKPKLKNKIEYLSLKEEDIKYISSTARFVWVEKDISRK